MSRAERRVDPVQMLSPSERDLLLWGRALCERAAAHAEREGHEGELRAADYEAAVRSMLTIMSNMANQTDYGRPHLPIEIAALIRVIQDDGG